MRVAPAALLLPALLLPAPARATTGPTGRACNATAVTVTAAGTGAGELDGGPYAATGMLVCTLQSSPYHDGGAAALASRWDSGVVTLPPTPVVFHDPAVAYVCTQFTITGGATLYWTAGGVWTLDPHATCLPFATHLP
jgi:hypothetical protein